MKNYSFQKFYDKGQYNKSKSQVFCNIFLRIYLNPNEGQSHRFYKKFNLFTYNAGLPFSSAILLRVTLLLTKV